MGPNIAQVSSTASKKHADFIFNIVILGLYILFLELNLYCSGWKSSAITRTIPSNTGTAIT
jgi:hypothetical protein